MCVTLHHLWLNVPQRSSRISWWEREIEAVLKRLDRLTQEEVRIAVAKILAVVSGFEGYMEGVECLHDGSWIFF